MKKIIKPGFTLVELLVVIAIIGILATLAIVSLQNARSRARDAKRIADIKQIQTALELYFNDNGAYPASTSVTSSIRSISRVYMEKYPQAPNPPDGDCTEENNEYVYTEAGEDNGSYVLTFCLGGLVASLTAGSKEASPVGIIAGSGGGGEDEEEETPFLCEGNISYGGEDYPIVEIGTQCWMAENLNIGTRIAGTSDQTDNSIIEKYCYSNSDSNCDIYGGLYQWNEMMQYNTSEPNQGICPVGWHIPSDAELSILTTFLNSNQGSKLAGNYNLWIDGNLRNNSDFGYTNFNALPAGGRSGNNGAFFGLGGNAYFWSSSETDPSFYLFWYRDLSSSSSGVLRSNGIGGMGLPVRCSKD